MVSAVPSVRPGESGDIAACLEIETADGNVFFLDGDFRRALVDRDAIFLVAEVRDSVIGFVFGFVLPTKPSEAMIHATVVHPRQRHRGVGTALVNAFALEAFNRRVRVVFAEVETGPDRFYEACGFRKEAVWNSYAVRRDEFMKRLP
jgi:ribosomal protein S18 acetylase RimI-like enzyme